MARKKKIPLARPALIVAVLLLVAACAWLWLHRGQFRHGLAVTSTELPLPQQSANNGNPTTAPAQSINVSVSGKLEIVKPPRDNQIGIIVDAVMLLRSVAIYQWQEHCDGGTCRYDTAWSDQHIDSHKFRASAGHENVTAPFTDARFVASDVRLGALMVDPELVTAQHPAIDYAVKPNALPPNLAATFSVVDGVLYAGGDAAHPQPGTLRIRYRIVPGGEVSLSGVRRGDRLEAR